MKKSSETSWRDLWYEHEVSMSPTVKASTVTYDDERTEVFILAWSPGITSHLSLPVEAAERLMMELGLAIAKVKEERVGGEEG